VTGRVGYLPCEISTQTFLSSRLLLATLPIREYLFVELHHLLLLFLVLLKRFYGVTPRKVKPAKGRFYVTSSASNFTALKCGWRNYKCSALLLTLLLNFTETELKCMLLNDSKLQGKC